MNGLATVLEIPPAVNVADENSIAVLESAHGHELPDGWVEAAAACEGQAPAAGAGFLLAGESVSRGDSR